MTLSELIERLEKATGPDRELDERIGGAAGVSICWPWTDQDGRYIPRIDVPRYTASLDAALTLVPEGPWMTAIAGPWRYAAHHPRAGQDNWECALTTEDVGEWCIGDYGDGDTSGKGANAAIAVCIASLKARARTGGEDGRG